MIDQGITSLDTGAPDITYSGNEGPKSPEQEQQMLMAQLQEEYEKYVFEMEEQGIQPMSLEQFMEQALAEGQMSEGPPLPNDPTEPVNPFGPKPIGPVLPDRQMAAFGGIMGLDQRRQYGIGSKFKRAWNKVTSPFTKVAQKLMPKELAGIAQMASPFAGPIYGPLLMAAGQAKQRGRISPAALAMSMLPYAKFKGGEGIRQLTPTGYGGMGSGQSLRNIFLRGEQNITADNYMLTDGPDGVQQLVYRDRPGILAPGSVDKYSKSIASREPIFGKYGKATDKFLFGSPKLDDTGTIDPFATAKSGENVMVGGSEATRGILGAEGVVGNLYSSEGLDALKASKLAGAALGKDGQLIEAAGKGGLSNLKLGSWAIGIVSGIQAGKYADEQAAADAAEEAALAADSEASAATLQAARAWAIETFSKMSVYADGGRIGFQGGGSDASTTSFSKSYDRQHGTNTASRANKTVDAQQAAGQRDADRTNKIIEANRQAAQYELQPPKKRNIIQKSYDKYNRTNIPTKVLLNLLMAGQPEIYQKAFQAGNVISGGIDRLNNPYYNEEEDTSGIGGALGLITDTQKGVIDAQGKMGKLTEAFNPDDTFDAAKGVFDVETGTYSLDDKGEKNIFSADRPAKPMTRPEYDAYVKEKGYAHGGPARQNFGISSMQRQDVTPPGMELDLRVGGFIPIGAQEKADDVKARVSKNEFVFTADAVKAAGGGSVNEGAKRMYDTMKRLESQVA